MSKYGVWLYEWGTDPMAGRWLKDDNAAGRWLGSKEDAEFHAGIRNQHHPDICYEAREVDEDENRED